MAIQAGSLNANVVTINRSLLSLRREADKLVDECKGGSLKLHNLVAAKQAAFRNALSEINTVADAASMRAYEAVHNGAFTFSTELATLNTLVNSLIKYITANISKDGDSNIKFLYLDANDVLQQRESTDAKFIADIQSRAQAISDTITVI